MTGSLGNTFPRISCQEVSGLESTRQRPQSLKCQGKQKPLLFIQSGDLLGFNKRCSAAPLHPPGSCSSGVRVTWDHRWKLPGILEVPNALMAGDAIVTNNECFLWSLLLQPFQRIFKPLVHCIKCLPACNTRLVSSFLWLNSDWYLVIAWINLKILRFGNTAHFSLNFEMKIL